MGPGKGRVEEDGDKGISAVVRSNGEGVRGVRLGAVIGGGVRWGTSKRSERSKRKGEFCKCLNSGTPVQ